MRRPEFPEPIGVFRQASESTFEEDIRAQVTEATNKKGAGDLQRLLTGSDTWTVA